MTHVGTLSFKRNRVLLIKLDPERRILSASMLEKEFEVVCAASMEEGFGKAEEFAPDVILLDVRAAESDGHINCEKLRNSDRTRHIPVLMISGDPGAQSRLQAFAAGADDFIVKPYTEIELLHRVRSKIRRAQESQSRGAVSRNRTLTCGNLLMDTDCYQVRVGSHPVELTPIEFRLLEFLLENQHRAVSRREILQSVWSDCKVTTRTVDSHVSALRRKLVGFNRELSAIYRVGYVLRKIDPEYLLPKDDLPCP